MIPSGARCGTHGAVAAVDLCQRCGRFLCGDCVELVRDEVYCADCAARLDLPPGLLAKSALLMTLGAYSAAALLAFAPSPLAFVGLVIVPGPVALAALVVAIIEWRRIKGGRAPYRGRRRVLTSLALAPPLLLAAVAFWLYAALRFIGR